MKVRQILLTTMYCMCEQLVGKLNLTQVYSYSTRYYILYIGPGDACGVTLLSNSY